MGETRTVGERGQVTIPKWMREEKGIEGGDEVEVREDDGKIILEKQETDEELQERLKEGYQEMAELSREINREMAAASSEAWEMIDDAD